MMLGNTPSPFLFSIKAFGVSMSGPVFNYDNTAILPRHVKLIACGQTALGRHRLGSDIAFSNILVTKDKLVEYSD